MPNPNPETAAHHDSGADSDGGLNMIRQMRSSDPIYRKISTAQGNEEVGRVTQGSKFGHEIMTCAFAPDGSVLAWSVGSNAVSLHSVQDLLPTLTPAGNSLSPLKNWPQNQTLSQSHDVSQGKVDYDCGQAVTALAFGVRGDTNLNTRRSSEVKYQRFSTKGNLLLAIGLGSGDIKIIDVATGKLVLLLQDHTDAITSLHFTPDGSFVLVSASKDCTVKLWDLLDDGNMFKSLAPKEFIKPIKQVAWSSDAKRLATVGDGKVVLLWELSNFTVEKSLQGHQNDVTGCRFSEDGQLLYTSSFDTRVICWNVESGEIVRKFEHMSPPPTNIFAAGTNEHEVIGLDFKKERLVTICNDGFLRVWNVSSKESKPIACVRIAPDARTVASSANEECIAIGCQGGFLQFYNLD